MPQSLVGPIAVVSQSLSVSRFRALIAVAVCTLPCASCSYFLGPDDELNAEVSFDVSPDAGQDLPDSATVVAVDNGLEIIGAITTSDGCRELNGTGSITSNQIEITIRADAEPEACPGVLGRFDYQIAVSDVRSGPWIVLVRHRRYGEGESTLIATKSVVVP